MFDAPRASPSADNETLSTAIARAARNARWPTLVAFMVAGAIGVSATWFVASHRVVLAAAALAVGAFGLGGAADRILNDERASGDPDRVLLVGFTTRRWLSVGIGACAAIVFVAWIFFGLLGRSFSL
jgi:hypothetical protein